MGTYALPIIIDCGSGSCKAGFASDLLPRSEFQSIVFTDGQETYIGGSDYYFEAEYPIQRGTITNWDDMESIWHYIIQSELGVQSEHHPILITEVPNNDIIDREKMTQIMFETFNVPVMYVGVQAVLSLYASGRTTGVILDSGDGVTHAVSVYQDYALPNAISRIELAGRDLAESFVESFSVQPEIAQAIKEQFCYVAHDFDAELVASGENRNSTLNCQLPDGNIIPLGKERFLCPEALFKSGLLGLQYKGVHEMIYDSIMSCEEIIHPQLYSNVVLSGGSTMFPGMTERMMKELIEISPPSTRIRIAGSSIRKYSTWVGGTILTSLPQFSQMWIAREDYGEYGPAIVHWKCLI
ncbi:unnamed protein product [Hymenolepis diminuta]|uniref:Actin n=1 Tax=Hymenolepis diminuta TaxID=6216 RepID=A0A0R3SBK8_HYMDI|nr:unnamed protein product [Hymenolepis diminuta]